MFYDNVSVSEPHRSIDINITTIPDSNLIKLSNLSSEIKNITIYDLSGNLVDVILNGNSYNNSIDYNTSYIAMGLYLLKIDTGKDTITKKIIIE